MFGNGTGDNKTRFVFEFALDYIDTVQTRLKLLVSYFE